MSEKAMIDGKTLERCPFCGYPKDALYFQTHPDEDPKATPEQVRNHIAFSEECERLATRGTPETVL